MKTYLDCIPCFFKQVLESTRNAGASEQVQREALLKLAKLLPDIPMHSTPPESGKLVHGIIRRITGNNDPYLEIKDKSNRLALDVYDDLKKKLSNSEDRLSAAVELAITGNIIDFGVKNTLDVDAEISRIVAEKGSIITSGDRSIFDIEKFIDALSSAETVLFLADNAGEVVFDKILIEEINSLYPKAKIIYAVKDKPIINDALIEDAFYCGIDKVADVISSGSDAPGTVLYLCSEEFMKIYSEADVIISKGQGNYEALSDEDRPIYFLLMAKCPVIADDIGCKVGDRILIKKSDN